MEGLAILFILLGMIGLPVGGLVLVIVLWRRMSDMRFDLRHLTERVEQLERRPAAPPASPPPVLTPPPVTAPARGERPVAATPGSAFTPAEPARPVPPPHAPPSVDPAHEVERTPNLVDDVVDRARAWLFGGNVVVRVGVIVLFFGVAFFLNFAVDQGWFPVPLRLLFAALGGLALVGLGWRLRDVRRDYALVLQGGGVGIVYLTVFAAANLYELVAPGLGMLLMVALVTTASGLAVVEDAMSLAVLAALGGFLAPVLVGGDGSHVALFGYYTVLNGGVVAIAWFKTWRTLNVLGFAATFVLTAAWGSQFYEPEYFASTEPFLVGFFLCYVAVPVLNATHRPEVRTPRLDGTLLFGVPLAAFALQAPLVRGFEYGLATSALVAGIFYGGLAWTLRRHLPEASRLLVEVFTALGVAFGTLANPLAFDGQVTGGAWALEGAGLVWIGVRQRRERARIAGLILQGAAGYLFLLQTGPARDVPVLNSIWLGAALVSMAGLFSGWYLERHRDEHRVMAAVPTGLLWWGLSWWVGAGLYEIVKHAAKADTFADLALFTIAAPVLFLSGTAAPCAWLRTRLAWPALVAPPCLLLPALAVLALAAAGSLAHPFAGWAILAWGAAIGVHYWIQRRLESEWPDDLARWWHAAMLWLVVFLGIREAAWLLEQIATAGDAWRDLWILVAVAAIVGMPVLIDRVPWPFGRFSGAYRTALVPLSALAAIWIVVESTAVGSAEPLPYLPLVNPLELTQGFILGVLLRWSRLPHVGLTDRTRWTIWSVLAFVALNGVIARATHFYGGVAFDADALWASARYQTAVSIVWTMAALSAMLSARWLRERAAWFAGAALLALVVGKLFLVDLNDVGTIPRIVSFIVVGLLTLVVGYVSPLPPRATTEGGRTGAP